jgi:hypothetical protein
MGKHHTEDYKLSAVKYALQTDSQVETCEVFDCKRSSLQKRITYQFEDIKKTLAHSIKKVKEKNYQNYFIHAFNVEWLKKNRKTRR